MPAEAKIDVESNIEELNALRRTLLQMLFVEGNHFCPSCEASGNCQLQATAYELQVMTPTTTSSSRIALWMPRIPTSCSTLTAAFCANCACALPAKWTAKTYSPCPDAVSPNT
jgi:predicted molibdopterin-dependent oxidoreductase YjgC